MCDLYRGYLEQFHSLIMCHSVGVGSTSGMNRSCLFVGILLPNNNYGQIRKVHTLANNIPNIRIHIPKNLFVDQAPEQTDSCQNGDLKGKLSNYREAFSLGGKVD